MTKPIYLHGGGDHPNGRATTLGRFVQATRAKGSVRIALIVVEPTEEDASKSAQAYCRIFEAIGVQPTELRPVLVSPINPLTYQQLAQIAPTGLFVCGGITPLYHEALCCDMKWLDYLEEFDIPYGGTSAGAAIAARHAILGGWQRECDGTVRSILFPGASEGLDFLTIRPGLALVPFAVDVHASQMGTLTRLIHAVDSRQVAEGWAIDENTLLQVSDEGIQVYGQGHAYRVQRNNQRAIAIETVHCQSE